MRDLVVWSPGNAAELVCAASLQALAWNDLMDTHILLAGPGNEAVEACDALPWVEQAHVGEYERIFWIVGGAQITRDAMTRGREWIGQGYIYTCRVIEMDYGEILCGVVNAKPRTVFAGYPARICEGLDTQPGWSGHPVVIDAAVTAFVSDARNLDGPMQPVPMTGRMVRPVGNQLIYSGGDA